MRKVDIIIPSCGMQHLVDCIHSLRHIPFDYRVILGTDGDDWPDAVNLAIKEARPDSDIILMDDDVRVCEDTFRLLDEWYDEADIFGFKLIFEDGSVQHFGGMIAGDVITHYGFRRNPLAYMEPVESFHATTSLVYIKRSALDDVGLFAEDYPGYQFEDTDWMMRAFKEGKRIVILPGVALHLESATKKHDPNFGVKLKEASDEFTKRHMGNAAFVNSLRKYPIPAVKRGA